MEATVGLFYPNVSVAFMSVTPRVFGRRMRTRTKDAIAQAIEAHADTVLRVCTIYLREPADREDAFQETFLRLARHKLPFTDDEHRKAWLIRVCTNVCKDMLKRASRRDESLEVLDEGGFTPAGDDGQEGQRALESQEVVHALTLIDERYRMPLYLKFYEDYTASEIARALSIPENTVYTYISRGKQQLKGVLSHGLK